LLSTRSAYGYNHGMGRRVTEERNREILAAIEAGETRDQLCQCHGLSLPRLREILMDERCRRRFSAAPFYRNWRKV